MLIFVRKYHSVSGYGSVCIFLVKLYSFFNRQISFKASVMLFARKRNMAVSSFDDDDDGND